MTQNPGVYTDKNIVKRLFVKNDIENMSKYYKTKLNAKRYSVKEDITEIIVGS